MVAVPLVFCEKIPCFCMTIDQVKLGKIKATTYNFNWFHSDSMMSWIDHLLADLDSYVPIKL